MARCPRCGSFLPEDEKNCVFCQKHFPESIDLPDHTRTRTYRLEPEEPIQKPRVGDLEYAEAWRRCCAFIPDLGLFLLTATGVYVFLGAEKIQDLTAATIVITLALFLLVVVPLFLSSRYQATPGKMLLGIIVVDMNGHRISFFQAIQRELGKFVSLLTAGIGFLMIGFTKRKQGLHDHLAQTLVMDSSSALVYQQTLSHPYDLTKKKLLGAAVIVLCILGTSVPVVYASKIANHPVTPANFAAEGVTMAADSIAATKYPEYSLSAYDAAIALEPDDSEIHLKKIALLGRMGRNDEAKTYLDQMIEMYPNETTPIILQGDIYLTDGNFDEAVACYEKALTVDPRNPKIWVKKGDAYLIQALRETQNMKNMYRGLSSNPAGTNPSKNVVPVDAFRSTKPYQEAVKAYNKAIELDPLLSVVISGRILTSTENLVDTSQTILEDIGKGNG